ncbi:hypothetical protein CBP36_21520 (plasmid) [Acidovorax carolinensis]|uniref:Uncharacterized protein n=1 Tax=Acidovorax carolinensis TaxID=553814 RepID=A0A240UKK0_9BURK|nr:hypothetical protein CBP36_21520 [Acidovorax carolinensis]
MLRIEPPAASRPFGRQSLTPRAVPALRAPLARPEGRIEELSRAKVQAVDLIRGVPALVR